MNVGVIGLGNIGNGVAKNLATAGHTVFGYDTEPARIAEAGAQPANHNTALAAAAINEIFEILLMVIGFTPPFYMVRGSDLTCVATFTRNAVPVVQAGISGPLPRSR